MDPPPLSRWRLNSPFNQNFIMGVILFCLPGIYLALTGLGAGGGGPNSAVIAVRANAILYGIFTISGWFAGPVLNVLKPRLTIFIGAIGYPIYVGSLWYFDRIGHPWFPYFGGAFLGVTAGCLWTGAGYIAYAYAEEKDKGKFIAIQWALTSLGGTVGAAIAFGLSVHETGDVSVPSSVYTTFVVIMCVATVASLFLIRNPESIVRDDGTHIAEFKPTNIRHEMGNLRVLVTDWRVAALVPAFFVAEFCLATVSSINSYYFALRARSLNNVLFQFIMIVGSLGLSYILDHPRLRRRQRGLIASVVITIITAGSCIGIVVYMKINNLSGRLGTSPDVDWTDHRFAGGVILYLLWGIVYASYLTCTQWVIASLSNDPAHCAMYSGFGKGTSSLGLCICFVMDSQSVTYMTQVIIEFVLYIVGGLLMTYVAGFHIPETNYFTEANVIVPTYVTEKHNVESDVQEVSAE